MKEGTKLVIKKNLAFIFGILFIMLILPFSIIFHDAEVFNNMYDFLMLLFCILLVVVPIGMLSSFFLLRYIKNFLHKDFLADRIVSDGSLLSVSLLNIFISTYYNVYIQFRLIIFAIHLSITIIGVSVYLYSYFFNLKKSFLLYYKEKFDCIFIDTFEISGATSRSVSLLFTKIFTQGIFYYLFLLTLTLVFVHDVRYILIVSAAFASAGLALYNLVRSCHTLLVILPEVKRKTGFDVRSDYYHLLNSEEGAKERLFRSIKLSTEPHKSTP